MNDTTYYSTTDYGTTSYDGTTASPAAIAGFIIFGFVFFLAIYALFAWLLGRIFKKAGVPAWAAWVPVYNSWKLLEIGGQQGFWAILAFLPIVSYVSAVFTCISMYNIGLKLGKSGAFVVLAIFLPIVWVAILAFDKSTWNNSVGAPSLGDTPAAPTPPPATPIV